jgi:hypothetical protein
MSDLRRRMIADPARHDKMVELVETMPKLHVKNRTLTGDR